MRQYHDIIKYYNRIKSHKNVTTEDVILISKYQCFFISLDRELFIHSSFCNYIQIDIITINHI